MENDHLKQALNNLEEVNKVISNLDAAIKVPAFEALRPLILGISPKRETNGTIGAQTVKAPDEPTAPADTSSLTAFFADRKGGKPVDNVYLIYAWFYSQHGVAPIPVEEVKALGDQVGLITPTRIDMTIKRSRYFLKVGVGAFQPTVQGELYFQKTFGVTKGTQPRTTQGASA